MIYVVTHYHGYEDSQPVAAYRKLSQALEYAKTQAEAHAANENKQLRLNHEATITRYYENIKQHGPDHVPDELTTRTTVLDGPPDPWLTMTLAERLAEIERRGPGRVDARFCETDLGPGYIASHDQWLITELDDA